MNKNFAIFILLLVLTTSLKADETLVAIGQWQGKTSVTLKINLSGLISKKQRTLIDSGFSTFSHLMILEDIKTPKQQALYKVSCTVRYDTWEEQYDLARLNDSPETLIIKDFNEYAKKCLAAELKDSKVIEPLTRSGGNLYAKLVIYQISAEKSDEVKQWLVKQQSGMIQGLFAHMVGEIKLSEEVDIVIQISPLKAGHEK